MLVHVRISDVFRQYLIIIIANFNILLLGMEAAWVSPVLVKLRDVNQTMLDRPITEEEGTWIVSLPYVVGLSLTFAAGYLTDSLGRKRCIILATVPRIAVCLLYIFATDVWMLYLGRGLCGFSEAISLSVVPAYASEIGSKEIRGALGTITQIMSAIGMMVMLSVGPFVTYLTLNIIYAATVFIPFIAQLFLPESPYFLHAKGHTEDSLKVLISIRNSEEIAREELKEYSLNSNVAMNKMELLKDKTVLKTIGKAVFLGIAFQLIGYNALLAYLQMIFESTKTNINPQIESAVIGCTQLLACFCTIFLTDKFGRKPILTITLLGMALGMIGLGSFFALSEDHATMTGVTKYLPLVSIILVIFCFNAGMGSIIWMLVAELFDGPTRAAGMSCSFFASAVSIFLLTQYFTLVVNTIGPAPTYWIFSVNCIITCLFVIFLIPETKRRAFSEIQKDLGRGSKTKDKTPVP